MAERARAADRALAGAYYDRAAEFFMTATDPRRSAARARFLQAMRAIYDVAPEFVPFRSGSLPVYDLRPDRQVGVPIVMFGGFDSYVEEFFPMIAGMVDAGRRIVVFEGPGQGSALEDFGLTMIPEWEQPVAAVLDHYGLDDVAAVGISLGGGLVMRAASVEPRITHAVAFDILDDFFEVIAGQIGRGVRFRCARYSPPAPAGSSTASPTVPPPASRSRSGGCSRACTSPALPRPMTSCARQRR
ncbi:MAG: hypothetical protein QOK09_1513 [Mycobacterium sp.]|nr:hypothetical protein [Mycobacterium sp.]